MDKKNDLSVRLLDLEICSLGSHPKDHIIDSATSNFVVPTSYLARSLLSLVSGQLHIEALLLSYALSLPTVEYLDATRVGGVLLEDVSFTFEENLDMENRRLNVITSMQYRLALTSEGAMFHPAIPPPVAVLSCGHIFHDQCLENITPEDQAKDPPCIPCATIGEIFGYILTGIIWVHSEDVSPANLLPPWHQFLDQKIRGAHFSLGIVAGERFAIDLTPSTFPQRHVAGERVGMLLGKASNVVVISRPMLGEHHT
ncbi:hypothetical protein Tco_0422796 [Tanacetum coccineum]